MAVTRLITVGLLAFATTAALVPVARGLARRRGVYARPVPDRWHHRPVPKLGGLAMAGVLLPLAYVTAGVPAFRLLSILSALMFIVGLIDDMRPIGPAAKFFGQSLGAVFFLSLVPPVAISGVPWLDAIASFLWLVGITNAFNLLDNIDGLAAGVAAIAGTVLLVLAAGGGLVESGAGLAAMAGAAVGFLIYNWAPASIFMGDSGSHLLGSFIAGSTMLLASTAIGRPETVCAIAAVLLVPIADTALVALTRARTGRNPFLGGRDHASHRLVALGMGERTAVLTLWTATMAGGAVALALQFGPPAYAWTAAAIYVASISLAGVFLGRVRIEPGWGSARQTRDTPLRVPPRDAIAAASQARAVRPNPIP